MKCKFITKPSGTKFSFYVIESKWNVNRYELYAIDENQSDVIESKWNVNVVGGACGGLVGFM